MPCFVPSAMFVASGPTTTLACVHPLARPSASPSPPLLPPLQHCPPQRTAGSSRISSAALLHNARITDYSLLLPLLDLKFGEVEGRHFSLLSSLSNMMLASVCTSTEDGLHKIKCILSATPQIYTWGHWYIKMHNWLIQTWVKLDAIWRRLFSK